MQSLQSQFVKSVTVDGVHIVVPNVKVITCIHSVCHLLNYLQMQNKTTN